MTALKLAPDLTTAELLAMMRERYDTLINLIQAEHETAIAAKFQKATTEAELEQAALFRAVLENLTNDRTFIID